MDKDLVERLAREAGIASGRGPDDSFSVEIPECVAGRLYDPVFFGDSFPDSLLRFAALIAEECAKVCDELADQGAAHDWPCPGFAADTIREKFGP